MLRNPWLVLLTAAALTGCARATPEQQIVEDAATALGGRDKVLAVKTLVLEGKGTNWNLGQDMSPEAASQTFTVTAYKRAIDVTTGRARTEQTRTPNFLFFQGPQAQTQITGIDREVGYNVSADGAATRVANAVASDRRVEVYHHPLTIVRAALDPAAKLANPKTQDNQRLVDITTADGLNFTLAIDGTTGLPARVVSMADNANLGDVAIETSFANYQDIDGLKLPTLLTMTTGTFKTAEMTIAKQDVDGDVGNLAAPDAAASAAPIAGPPAVNIVTEQVAPGVTLLVGGANSVAVEFSDHVMLVEAPQPEARTLAVIAKAKELFPNKPLTQVVNTHHHFDHSGGIRAAVSEGLTVITHAGNAAFYGDVVKRPHTIVPDALAKNQKPLTIEPVNGEKTIEDKTMTVNLYDVPGNGHSDTMIMAYLPQQRLLIVGDLFSSGRTYNPYVANLLENIKKRKLRVDRVLPIHGKLVPYAELVKAAPTS